MDRKRVNAFHIAGLAVRTTNEKGRSSKDIPALWNKFMSEGIMDKIPDKAGNDLYCIYTDYEKDHTKPYTAFIGCRVNSLEAIPEGLTGKSFAGGSYISLIAKGNLLEGMVFDEWTKIWNSDIPRAYTADFEIYGEKAKNPEDAEVEIFLAVK